jgi:hypothetical protein
MKKTANLLTINCPFEAAKNLRLFLFPTALLVFCIIHNFNAYISSSRARGSGIVLGSMLQAGRSLVQIPMPLDFLIDLTLPAAL